MKNIVKALSSASVKARLLRLTLFLQAGILVVGLVGSYAITQVGGDLEKTVNESIPVIRSVTLIDMVHDGVNSTALAAYIGVLLEDSEQVESARKNFEEHKRNAAENFAIIFSKGLDPDTLAQAKKAEAEMSTYLGEAEKLFEIASIPREKNSNHESKVQFMKNQWQQFQLKFGELEKNLALFGDNLESSSSIKLATAVAFEQKMIFTLLALFGIVIVLGLGVSSRMIRSLTTELSSVSEMLRSTSEAVNLSAIQLFNGVQGLSASTQQQSSSLQETSSSISQISSLVENSSHSASEAKDKTTQSQSAAEFGGEIVGRLKYSISEIAKGSGMISLQVKENVVHMNDLVKLIKEVESKTRVINDIVFQTRLLSFNASVEAARAGEQGKGFAVVADEVGKLAQMSGAAAVEINTLLERSLVAVNQIVGETEEKVDKMVVDSSNKISDGSKITEECEVILNKIISFSKEVAGQVNEIADASLQSANGVKEISVAIQQLNKATEANASLAIDSSQSVKNLENQVKELQIASNLLQVVLYGTTRTRVRPEPHRVGNQ